MNELSAGNSVIANERPDEVGTVSKIHNWSGAVFVRYGDPGTTDRLQTTVENVEVVS